jgi:capsular polysaccharide biosynthesis protein
MDNTPNYAGSPEDQQPLSAQDVAKIVRRRLWVIILVPLVMAGTAVGFSFLQTPVYETSAKLLVGQEQGQVGDPAKPDDLQLLTQSAVEVITTRPVAEETTRRLGGFPTQADNILENLTAEQIVSSQFIQLTYTDTDPQRAQQIVNTVGEVAAERISTLPMSANDIKGTVVESATAPRTPENPDPLRNGILAAGLGIMLGFGLAFVMEYLDPNGKPRRKPE